MMTQERRELLMGLREGDVIRLNGTLRVVRKINDSAEEKRGRKRGYPRKRMFSFAILRCSWTHRPYTCYTTSDMGNPKWSVELVMRNYKPKAEIEVRLNEEIARAPAIRPYLDCCDIRGIT